MILLISEMDFYLVVIFILWCVCDTGKIRIADNTHQTSDNTFSRIFYNIYGKVCFLMDKLLQISDNGCSAGYLNTIFDNISCLFRWSALQDDFNRIHNGVQRVYYS